MPAKTCTLPGCDKPYRARGTCWGHRPKENIRVKRYEPGATCSVDGCYRTPKSVGMCGNHRRTFLRHGDPLHDERKARIRPWKDRFWDKVYPCPWTGCWHWGGAIYRKRGGYGSFTVNRTARKAHVIAYEVLVGPVPEGLVLDHLCRVTCCVNPDHLEPVTLAENTRRAHNPANISRWTGVCISGMHAMTPDNVYVRPDGSGRWCRACATIRNRRNHARRRRQTTP